MKQIFAVKAYVDSVWQQFFITQRVLATNRKEAEKMVINHWKNDDNAVVVKVKTVIELGDFDKGEIILL